MPEPRSPESGAGPAQVQLIDGFGCRHRGRDVSLPLSGQRLVALLALSRAPVPRGTIVDLLWPDRSAGQSSGSLRTVVWRVRDRCLGLVESGPGTLGLSTSVEVDLHDLQDGIADWYAEGRHDPREVIDRLRPHVSTMALLPGWYDDWVMLHREALLGLRVGFLADAAKVLARAGDATRALDLSLAALGADPYDETLHVQVAAIHLTQGNVSEALRQYDLCASLFRSELGMEPSRSFRRMLPVPISAPATPSRALSAGHLSSRSG